MHHVEFYPGEMHHVENLKKKAFTYSLMPTAFLFFMLYLAHRRNQFLCKEMDASEDCVTEYECAECEDE